MQGVVHGGWGENQEGEDRMSDGEKLVTEKAQFSNLYSLNRKTDRCQTVHFTMKFLAPTLGPFSRYKMFYVRLHVSSRS